jgi:hypothetical protein
MIVAHRFSPEQPRRLPPAPEEPPRPTPAWRLFSEEPQAPDLPPASTAPPRLKDGALGKRKRRYTTRYKAAVAQGDIKGSQPGRAGIP